MAEANDKTLVIMAAGMGSRFGGSKQTAKVDDNGSFILDYSIYDAKQAGFNKVVLIIKEQDRELFDSTITKRAGKDIDIQYVYQSMDKFVPVVPDGRTKPWGTAHAVLCAKDAVQGNFAIVNADDLYGRAAFETAAHFMDNNTATNNYGFVAYQVGNTLTENGAVKRGVCGVEDGQLTEMIESTIERVNGQIVATPLAGGDSFKLNDDHPVSMNMICMHSDFFPYLENYFTDRFLSANSADLAKGENSKCECLIQDVLMAQANEGGATIQVDSTTAEWHGVTYKPDLPGLVSYIKEAVETGVYPEQLWTNAQHASPVEG